MDIATPRRRTRVEHQGEHLVIIHRRATVGQVDEWRQHTAQRPSVEADLPAWLRDGHRLAVEISSKNIIGLDEVTMSGAVPSLGDALDAIHADWMLCRHIVAQIIAVAELDAAVGKG